MVKKNLFDEVIPPEQSIWDPMQHVDALRNLVREEQRNEEKSAFGQFFTPYPIAELMASMLTCQTPIVRILDPGAGIGSLFTAAVTALCQKDTAPEHIIVTAYEIDDTLIEHLERAMYRCEEICKEYHVGFTGIVRHQDFIEAGVALLRKTRTLFSLHEEPEYFDCAILNPPYKKIQNSWLERQLLKEVGIEASNLYVGFLALAMKLLVPAGELVAITPRSFCNGLYFKKFRKDFLQTMALYRLHIFESRTHAFSDDEVLQENIILHAIKSEKKPDEVITTTSTGTEDDFHFTKRVQYNQVIQPGDPQSFIRILQDNESDRVIQLISQFTTSLEDLGIAVSTGRVVDFRAVDALHMTPQANTVPLLYPVHLHHGMVSWPISESKKPNAISDTDQTQSLLVPNQHYVLVKRFSSKEEKKRIVAVVYEPEQFPYPRVGFENHLNYFHQNGGGLDPAIAKGLVAYLNLALVDSYFRQFNGHTQVNATDLRNIKYPTRSQLEALGKQITAQPLHQCARDELITKILLPTSENEREDMQIKSSDPTKQKIEESLRIIKDLGFLRTQQNERSALTLLALLNLKPDTPWSQAEDPLCGITPMMDFFREQYGKDYKPNTRETVRRQTVHQFLEAGLLEANPDQPDRPINSPKAVYRIEQGALELFRTFGTPEWDQNLRAYLSSIDTLQKRYAKEREMYRIPVTLAPGHVISLSPGGQNILVEKIIHEFAERYTPGGRVLYVGDTDEKFAYFHREGLEELGVYLESHGKMPDVIIHDTKRNWLVLIEAVTSHGPIDGKRKDELERLFRTAHVGLVLVTAFLSRVAMLQYMKDIAWETEVWIAEAPTHLIHFNGDRFLGPYEKKTNLG